MDLIRNPRRASPSIPTLEYADCHVTLILSKHQRNLHPYHIHGLLIRKSLWMWQGSTRGLCKDLLPLVGQGRHVTSRPALPTCFPSDMVILLNVLHVLPLQFSNEKNNPLSFLCYRYVEYLLHNASFAVSRRNLRSEALDGDIIRLKVNCRPRHSKNAAPFARIESAVASMGMNIRENARTRVGRMEFSDWSLYKRVPMTLKCLDGSPPSVNFRR